MMGKGREALLEVTLDVVNGDEDRERRCALRQSRDARRHP